MDCPYKDPNAPIESRIQDLLSRMTLQEKIGQMTQIDRRVASPSAIRHFSIGSILSAGGGGPFEKATTSDWINMTDGFQQATLRSRLGIPLIYGTDAVHGNNNVDAELVRRIGVATALEVRACGAQLAFAPCVAVCKDPRWGRCYESYSEDSEIVRKMTSIVTVHFLYARENVLACAKHFVGDGGTNKGTNEGNTVASYDELERIHMAPYLDCISRGVCTIMASYSSWNGRQLHSDHFLLTQVLKEKLGFKGFVISDSEALDRLSHPYGSNYRNCVLLSVNAGIDMVMVPFRYKLFIEDLTYLVESGKIPVARIDDAVERILRVKFVAGVFEYPLTDRSLLDTVGCKLHRELAREAVRKSLVLLKNGKDPRKPFLPLNRNAVRILVAGTHADNLGYQCGGWTATWNGASGRITIGATILEALKAAVGDKTELVYEQCPSADTFATQEFSFAIVAVGEEPYAESLGDNLELTIPFNGTELISSVADKVPTLVILISGRPLVLEPWLLEKIDGLVAAWLPGSEGEGIADVVSLPNTQLFQLITSCNLEWSINSAGGGGPFEKPTTSDWINMTDGFQQAALRSRLGIPLLYGTDAVHGNNNVDAELVRRIGVATALEVRACGAQFTFAPCVAVCKDPRWGRCYESYSEDSEIVRKMTSIVTGLQGQPPQGHPKGYPFVAGRENVVACAKHFVGDGGTNKGTNEGNCVASYDELERIHLAPYLDCISRGVCTIMASCSSWNERQLHSHHFLLTRVLKEKLGFMVMVPFRYKLFIEDLTYLVESGKIPIARIDDAVERILRVKFVAGVFEYPLTDRSLLDTVGCKLHRELAREAVRKSLVLLKNGKDPRKPFLPLNRNAVRILVAGTHADDLGYQCGGWTATWNGASGRITIGTTILEALKAAVGDKTELVYEQCPSADTFATQEFSFAIVAVGEEPYAETTGDNSELTIPFNGTELISSVADKVPTLVILISGRPLVLEQWLLEKIDGLVSAWLPGSEGEGIADVLFGDYEFQGRLPMTWFKRVEQLPMHSGENSNDPLFPFGFGLTSNNNQKLSE
ncbi:hypothetical protein RHGRI_002524 [Rhododendron griersonianum]|uniref:Beta-glucosidase n=1 Tax=Rhododendron griersonianum TaxID=479676 RepID=A0AAV6LRW6_9ERIC|nr:hypothetical protein RHGRI_002524 [Rhododendron griersonianum]